MFYRFRMALSRFMYGRYGVDSFGKFLCIFYIIFAIVINIIIRLKIGIYYILVLNLISYLLFFYTLFRIFSRNIHKRYAENQAYLNIKRKFSDFFSLKRKRFKERKTHIYRKCPNCKATIRLPHKKGKHTCCCPKCNKDFKVRVF